MSNHQIDNLINTNLLGVYYGLYGAPKLLNEGAPICVISSVSAYRPEVDEPLYAALKTGVMSLVRSFGMKYAGKYRVFGVAPGFCKTNLGGQDGKIPQELIDKVPVNFSC